MPMFNALKASNIGANQPNQSMSTRQRANSSITDMASVGLQANRQSSASAFAPLGRSVPFENQVRSLIDDKYNREYKLDKRTRAKALEILTDYFAKHQDEANNDDDVMLHTTVRAAILIASKCQVFQTDDGTQIRGCGLSTSTFLQRRTGPQIKIEEFQKKLQEVRLDANLEQVVIHECVKVQNKIGLNLNFYEKFTKLWEGLGIKDRSLQVFAATPIKKLTWLMFILGKIKILQGAEDIAEMAYLLYACLYWAIMLSPADVQCDLIDGFKESMMGMEHSMDERLALLDEKVRAYLTKALKAQQSTQQTDCMVDYLRDMLLKMKVKARLQGFSTLEDEIDVENNVEVVHHQPMTYMGVCDSDSIKGDRICHVRPTKCIHGIFDQGNLNRNIRMLDQYYAQHMNNDVDFDERFFINHNGIAHTPIKLVSPMTNFTKAPVALQQNSSTSGGHKSPLSKGAMGQMAAQNHQAFKRPRGESIPLKFVTPTDIPFQPKVNNHQNEQPDAASQNRTNLFENDKDGGQPMQRRLQFNSSLAEMNIRMALNQSPFPQLTPNQAPIADSQASPNINLQTPIGQMMQLKQWVDNLQREVKLDQASGFLASLPSYLKAPQACQDSKPEDVSLFYQRQGVEIREKVQKEMLAAIFNKLHYKRVIERPDQAQNLNTDLEQKHGESIFKIFCSLLDKTLEKELRRSLWLKKEMPEIVKSEVVLKSFLIYAALIHLYSKNISDLGIEDMLDVLQMPAYELFLTFKTFISLDPNLPRQLREHFMDIERQLALHLSWKKGTFVVNKLQKIIAMNEEEEAEEERKQQQLKVARNPTEAAQVSESFADVHKRQQVEEKVLSSLKLFCNRVKEICAQTIQEMCDHLQISTECREFIWNIVLVTLGLKVDLLFGRHVDQLIMCAIYGICKIHAGNKNFHVLSAAVWRNERKTIKFQDIIDSYKEIHKRRLQKSGRWQVNLSQSNSVSWVYIEVPLNPEDPNPTYIDIIKFYNDVYLDKMKAHVLKTKTMPLEGSKTPQLSQSNFDALLTPGGRVYKPIINHFTKLTPLIDSLGKNMRFSDVRYLNQAKGSQMVNTAAGALATPALQSSKDKNLPMMTPRTNALYATNERQFNTGGPQMSTTTDMARNYSQNAVHKLAAQMSFNSSTLQGQDQTASDNQAGKLGSFVSLASGPSDSKRGGMDRPPQPSFSLISKNPQNLGQMKAPPSISERPAAEECDYAQADNCNSLTNQQTSAGVQTGSNRMHSGFKIQNKGFVPSPNSIVGQFYKPAQQDSLFSQQEGASEIEVSPHENKVSITDAGEGGQTGLQRGKTVVLSDDKDGKSNK